MFGKKKKSKISLAPAQSQEQTQKLRPLADIQVDYTSLCNKAGHVQYQIYILTRDLETMNLALRDLNFEAAKSKQAEDEAAKKAAEEAPPAESPSEEQSK